MPAPKDPEKRKLWIEKLKQANTGENNPNFGLKRSTETKEKQRQAKLGDKNPRYGKPLSDKHRTSISKGMLKTTDHMKDKKECNDTLYQNVHLWMRKTYGQPQLCEKCGRTKPPRGKGLVYDYFQWCNKDGKYLKDRKKWLRLCTICHRNYDLYRKSNN